MHKKRRTFKSKVTRVEQGSSSRQRDLLIVEEPLTVMWQANDSPPERFSATMRTPGHDNELTAGLLFAEGLLHGKSELEVISYCAGGGVNELNRLKAVLRLPAALCHSRLSHRPSQALPQSACGLCSAEELGDPQQLVSWAAAQRPSDSVCGEPSVEQLHLALDHLQQSCPVFQATGASHACVVVDSGGRLLAAFEDVGRHNACDKALGSLLLSSQNHPFALSKGAGILFSSRLSFELAAKATRAGAAWVASVGAPTHLAVELAKQTGLPILGFLSKSRHNVY